MKNPQGDINYDGISIWLKCEVFFLFCLLSRREQKFTKKNTPTMRNLTESTRHFGYLFFFTLHFSHFIRPKWAIIWLKCSAIKISIRLSSEASYIPRCFVEINSKLMEFLRRAESQLLIKMHLVSAKMSVSVSNEMFGYRLWFVGVLFPLALWFYAP